MKVLILIVIFTCSLYAFDKREVLLKQANRLVTRRQYEKAINIYESLLEDYPDDHVIVERLIVNLLRISKIEKAEKILEDKKNILSGIEYVRLKTSILLLKGEIKQAYKFCKNFLNENSRRMNYYKILANIFEQYRQYEYAIEILKQARKIANDNHLHTKELAFNYQNLKDYQNAIIEYLKLLERQKSYYNFVLNRLKKILQEDKAYITTIEKSVRKSKHKKIQEIYALCLAEIGEYEKALKEYETLDTSKLKDFGDRLVSNGNLDIAISAYETYIGKIREPYLISDVKIKLAVIYITHGQLDKAKEVLFQVYEDSSIKGKKYR
ncbi:MAG: tetratricopeptide repeat protein, partial [Candidatus Cloacimonetes bacterium]|nr:tetratricopeptide repeat protein [Candidatus Cloacimonadota bacterium]